MTLLAHPAPATLARLPDDHWESAAAQQVDYRSRWPGHRHPWLLPDGRPPLGCRGFDFPLLPLAPLASAR